MQTCTHVTIIVSRDAIVNMHVNKLWRFECCNICCFVSTYWSLLKPVVEESNGSTLDQPKLVTTSQAKNITSNDMTDQTSAVDTEVPTKTWRIIVGRTATGKSRYAAKYVAAQGRGVQVLENLFDDNIADKLSNVRLDVQEVVLVTNGPEAAHKLANMLRDEHDAEPDVWAFARRGEVHPLLVGLNGLKVEKLFIPEVVRNPNGAWQEVLV
jgi:hypothetical protein